MFDSNLVQNIFFYQTGGSTSIYTNRVIITREKVQMRRHPASSTTPHRPVRLAYQPPVNSTFLSEQTSNQATLLFSQHKPASTISHQPNEHVAHVQFVRVLAPRS
jgi:hypothetical protein